MAYGIIDSGLGGYRNYLALRKAYPSTAFTFLADQINAPYGNKTKEELLTIASKNMQWFLSQGIHHVIIACNTMNSMILDELKMKFREITFHDIVSPTVESLKKTSHKQWLVLATQRTIDSHLYETSMEKTLKNTHVLGIALPKLVKLIEDMEDEAVIKAYLKETIGATQADAVLLGCTHYPIITDLIQQTLNAEVYDSEAALVHSLKNEAFDHGSSVCFTTGNAQHAIEQAKTLFKIEETFHEVKI